MAKLWIASVAAAAVVMVGCGGEKAPEKVEKKPVVVEAPATYKVKFTTTKGDFVVEVTRAWAPKGADRFYELVQAKYYDGAKFYRTLKKFIAQFGIAADPKMGAMWREMKISDDPVKEKNARGTLAFAMLGPATRTTQVFINLSNNSAMLDKEGFAPFGKVVEGMENVDKLTYLYGETMNRGGGGPDPTKAELMGNEYLDRQFPRLDGIVTARIVQ